MGIDQTLQHVAMHVFNGLSPKAGSKAVPIALDFSVANPYLFDTLLMNESEALEYVQAVYADNSANPYPFSITFLGTNQTLTWGPYQQGYLPALCTKPCKFSASIGGGSRTVNILLLNFPVPAMLWGGPNQNTISGLLTYSALGGSGNALLTNTAIKLKSSNSYVYGYNFYNAGINDAYVQFFNVGNAPTVGTTVPQMSIWVPAGGSWEEKINSGGLSFGSGIYVAATTTATGNGAPVTGILANIFYK